MKRAKNYKSFEICKNGIIDIEHGLVNLIFKEIEDSDLEEYLENNRYRIKIYCGLEWAKHISYFTVFNPTFEIIKKTDKTYKTFGYSTVGGIQFDYILDLSLHKNSLNINNELLLISEYE